MPRGDGSFFLYLHGPLRKASNSKVGDVVEVNLTFDSTYKAGPQHDMPAAFSQLLAASPNAQASWNGLIPSVRKEILRSFANLKSDAAKHRNYQRALRVLSGAKERFMARDWNE
jgi:Bacteriocin-protection, YdeI or OmpD-Associated